MTNYWAQVGIIAAVIVGMAAFLGYVILVAVQFENGRAWLGWSLIGLAAVVIIFGLPALFMPVTA